MTVSKYLGVSMSQLLAAEPKKEQRIKHGTDVGVTVTPWVVRAVTSPPRPYRAQYTFPPGPCVVATAGPPELCMVPPRDHDVKVSYDGGPYWNTDPSMRLHAAS